MCRLLKHLEETHERTVTRAKVSLQSLTSVKGGGLTELSSIVGAVKDGVVEGDAAAGVPGLHLPSHEGSCVLSLDIDDGDIPWI